MQFTYQWEDGRDLLASQLNDAWNVQATFGQQTFKAYSDKAARVSGLVMQAAEGDVGDAKH